MKEDKKWDILNNRIYQKKTLEDAMDNYINMYNNNDDNTSSTGELSHEVEDGLLPISMKIAASTISSDLVEVKPLELLDENDLKNDELELKKKIRLLKISNLNEKKDSNEKELEELKSELEELKEKMKSSPLGKLIYFDYTYRPENKE